MNATGPFPEGLDEVALRRPGWSSHTSATLSDAQVWHFPGIGMVELMIAPDLYRLVGPLPPSLPDPASLGQLEFHRQCLEIEDAVRAIAARLLALNYHIQNADADLLVSGVNCDLDFLDAVLGPVADCDCWPLLSPYIPRTG